MNMDIEKMRNKLEKVDVELRNRIRDERHRIDNFSMEDYMSELGEKLCKRSQKLQAASGYLGVAIECLFAAEQIDG